MAASTKAARRLGWNDVANACEVLLNFVNENKRKVLKLATCEQRLAQEGCGSFETLPCRLDTLVRPSGERGCLSRSRSDRSAKRSNGIGRFRMERQGQAGDEARLSKWCTPRFFANARNRARSVVK